MKKISALLILLCLGACSSSRPPPTIYALHAKAGKNQERNISHIISVAEPEVPAGFDTERIALYLYGGRRLDYYANLAWPEHLGKVLQGVIVQSALSVPGMMAVTPDSGIPVPYSLFVKVNDFAPVYAAGAESTPQLKASMSFRLFSLQGQETLLNTTLSAEKPAAANTQTAVISGIEELLQGINARAFKEISRAITE